MNKLTYQVKAKKIIEQAKKPMNEISDDALQSLFSLANNELREWEQFRDEIVIEFRRRDDTKKMDKYV